MSNMAGGPCCSKRRGGRNTKASREPEVLHPEVDMVASNASGQKARLGETIGFSPIRGIRPFIPTMYLLSQHVDGHILQRVAAADA